MKKVLRRTLLPVILVVACGGTAGTGISENPTTMTQTVTTEATTASTVSVTARNVLDTLVAGDLILDDSVGTTDISDTVTLAGTADPTDLRIEVFPTVEEATADRLASIDAAGGQGVAILQCQTIVVSVMAGVTPETTEIATAVADIIRPALEDGFGPC